MPFTCCQFPDLYHKHWTHVKVVDCKHLISLIQYQFNKILLYTIVRCVAGWSWQPQELPCAALEPQGAGV
jgi:hypothetical protein